MKRPIALLLSLLLGTAGCSTAVATNAPRAPARVDPALMAEYIRQLPVGARVKVVLPDRVLRGSLMRRDSDPIVVQLRTRIPEPPVEVPVRDILAMELETNGSTGRAIGIGVATGAGASLGVLLLLAAIFSD